MRRLKLKFLNIIKRILLFWLVANYFTLAIARTSVMELEAKLEELEEKLQSSINLEIANKVDFLQKEVQELRGLLEEQQHILAKIQSDFNNQQKLVSNNLDPHDNKVNLNNNLLKNNLLGTENIKDLENIRELKEIKLDPEQVKYNYAYKMIEEKNFPQAIIAFKDFLAKYPDSKYVPSGMYWLGELYLNENNLDLAESYFLQILEKHKEHNKAPDALLKLGVLEVERKNFSKAKEYLVKLTKDYSNSNRIKIAQAKLIDLEKIEDN